MVPQWHHSAPAYIITLDKKIRDGLYMIHLSKTIYESRGTLQRTWSTSVECQQSHNCHWSDFLAVAWPSLSHVVEVAVMGQDQHPSCDCHQYSTFPQIKVSMEVHANWTWLGIELIKVCRIFNLIIQIYWFYFASLWILKHSFCFKWHHIKNGFYLLFIGIKT